MKCHYEVLGVSQQATDNDLKKAYRKMALQWHPDKNPDRLEVAKKQFQLIQAAYETLSDHHERAFYDRNRESILRGKEMSSGGNPENLDLFQYFSRQCYSGYDDSEKGFYTVYRQVFENIVAMDMPYMDDNEDFVMPNFGASDSDLEDVGRFYRYWNDYCTSMDFHWAEEYDIREAHQMGRWVEKKVEKENRKTRKTARRAFNEKVRALVMFVQKRDKRCIARKKMLQEKALEKAQKQAERSSKIREEREKSMKEEIEAAKASMAEYEKELELLDRKFAQEWGLSEDEEYDDTEEDEAQEEETGEGTEESQKEEEDLLSLLDTLYCVACNKDFKTEKSMENHQRSKKHKENVETLKASMTAEDALYFQTEIIDPSIRANDDLPPVQNSSKKKKKKNKRSNVTEVPQDNIPPPDFSPEDMTQEQKNKQEQTVFNDTVTNTNDKSEKEDGNTSNVDRLCNESTDTRNLNSVDQNDREADGDERDETPKRKTKGKKAKDARRRAQESNREVNMCTVCGNTYPSKNKLFSHLKAEGHAALKTANGERMTKGQKRNK